jgi:hypothetical protein
LGLLEAFHGSEAVAALAEGSNVFFGIWTALAYRDDVVDVYLFGVEGVATGCAVSGAVFVDGIAKTTGSALGCTFTTPLARRSIPLSSDLAEAWLASCPTFGGMGTAVDTCARDLHLSS